MNISLSHDLTHKQNKMSCHMAIIAQRVSSNNTGTSFK